MTEIFHTMVNFLNKGGLFMWPLLFCSIVTVATIVMAALTLRERKVLPLVIESEIERLIPGGSAERLGRIVHDPYSSRAGRGRSALQQLRWAPAGDLQSGRTPGRRALGTVDRGHIAR